MTRSLQHFEIRDGVAAVSHPTTMSMTAATSPWKHPAASVPGARLAARPTAVSFSAGDFRSQHQQMLAFEQQLDSLVSAGGDSSNHAAPNPQRLRYASSRSVEMMEQHNLRALDRNLSTSSVASLPAFGANTNSRSGAAIKANLRLNVGTKITGRRHRTPRRFVVTDIPDFEEFGHPSSMKSDHSQSDPHRQVTTHQQRQGKTEVKGRFTIIDLSPESPLGSPSVQRSPLPERGHARHGDTPRKRGYRKAHRNHQLIVNTSTGSSSHELNSFRAESPKTPAHGSQSHVMYLDPVDTSSKTRRVDLNIFDRHLEYLQKESADMKTLLEGMVSTNARWINALGQAGVVFPTDQSQCSRRCSDVSVSEAVAPMEAEPTVVAGSSIEEKYAAMELAYVSDDVLSDGGRVGLLMRSVFVFHFQMELQKKHDALLAKNKKLEEQNETLESNLQQQTQVSEDLRTQLQHLSQYTENLISDSERSNEDASDMLSVFGDQSSVDVDDQSPVAATFSDDYGFQYELMKNGLFSRRQRRYMVDEECMSDTSSEGSMMKSRSRIFDDEDNNIQFSESDDDIGRDAKPYLLTANRFEHFMFHDDQSRSVRANDLALPSQQKAERSDDDEFMGMSSVDPLTSSASDVEDLQTSNQLSHSSSVPESMFKYLKRVDSLSSLLLHNYSTVSSNSSIASVGVPVASLTKSESGSYLTSSGSLFAREESPTNQQVDAKEEYTSLSTENLFFHNSHSSGKGRSSFGFDPHEDPSLQKMDDEARSRIPPQLYRQFSHH